MALRTVRRQVAPAMTAHRTGRPRWLPVLAALAAAWSLAAGRPVVADDPPGHRVLSFLQRFGQESAEELGAEDAGGEAAVAVSGPAAVLDHRHDPVTIDARPIVSRVQLALVRPRRVLVDTDGTMFVADWGADMVIKITPDGHSMVLAADLNEPAGLALDAAGNLYVANHAGGILGAGSVVKISPGGMTMVFAEGLNGPTGLAFDRDGLLYVADFHGDRLVRITPGGSVQPFVEDLPTPAAIAFDAQGYLYTVSSTEGAVYRIGPMGDVTTLARGLAVPSDLAFDPRGHLIVANYGGVELTYVTATGRSRPFATVPKGTIGLAFDTTGNLVFVNWDVQSLMRITLELQVPCPHCGKAIPVRLRPLNQPVPPTKRTPSGPII